MYCTNCGKELSDKAAVCPNCGTAINQNAFNSTQPTTQTNCQTNTLAIVGFVLSFFFEIAGLICSIIGYKQAEKFNDNCKGLALAGIIISSIKLVLGIALGILGTIWIVGMFFIA